MADSIEIQMAEILEDASKAVRESAQKAMQETAKEAASKLKSSSPKRSGNYASTWTTKTEKSRDIPTVIVHNSKHYQLTHLLENGHIVRNKYGTYGRAPAVKHIKPVEEWANEELVVRIKEELNDNL